MSARRGRSPANPAEKVRSEARAGTFELVNAPDADPGQAEATLPPPADSPATASDLHPRDVVAAPVRTNGNGTAPPGAGLDEDLVRFQETQAVFASTDKPVALWRQMLEVFVANRLAVISTAVLAIIVIGCYVGPHLYVTNQTNANALITSGAAANLPPSSAHWFGTDLYGWDELGRIMYAGQYSLSLGLFAGLVTIVVGTVYGMISGYFGGVIDGVMMRFIDAALSIPYLFLLVALVTIFGNGTTFLILVIGLTGWFGNSRIIRGDALVIRELEYSTAATSMGASRLHVIRRHVFPNSISNIVTVGTFSIADAILALSALGFIGFGLQQPSVDWGTMMNLGTQVLIDGYWWETYPVAIVFVVVIICINYIGDALRDIFEVRLRLR